jgi:hypothetical protein
MIELLERLKFVVIVLMMFNIHPDVLMHAQSGDGLPPFTKVWTDTEKMRFKECVSHISDPSRESTLQLSTDSYACLILEEEQHWMNLQCWVWNHRARRRPPV